MKSKIKKIVKNITPPVISNLFKKRSKYGLFGTYNSWSEAQANSKGYNDSQIVEKVKNSLLKVQKGETVFERDSVLFDHIQYSWPVLAYLLWIASKHDNNLNIIDFGGSLGSSYFQNIAFLSHLNNLKWNIVEQKKFVEYGKQYFENKHLRFYSTIEEYLQVSKPHAILFSSVLEYIQNPYEQLTMATEHSVPYIIIDRTSFFENEQQPEVITVQNVPPRIYKASYPCHIFNKTKLINHLSSKGYVLLTEFTCPDKIHTEKIEGSVSFKGLIFELK